MSKGSFFIIITLRVGTGSEPFPSAFPPFFLGYIGFCPVACQASVKIKKVGVSEAVYEAFRRSEIKNVVSFLTV